MRDGLRRISNALNRAHTSHDHGLPVQSGRTSTFWQVQHRHAQQQVKHDESSADEQNGKHYIQTIRAITAIFANERARFPPDWEQEDVLEPNTPSWTQSIQITKTKSRQSQLLY